MKNFKEYYEETMNEGKDERIRLVVIDEHTLGYIDPSEPNYAGILHTSVLKGSMLNKYNSVILLNKTIRTATKKDFDEYRVSFKGYSDKKKYIYK